MNEITNNLLELMCGASGARCAFVHARVRNEGGEITVMEHRYDRADSEHGRSRYSDRQIRFTLQEPFSASPDAEPAGTFFPPRESAGIPAAVPEYISNPINGWNVGKLGTDLWRFSTSMEELLIDLVLGLGKAEGRRLRESIDAAGSYLELLGRIVSTAAAVPGGAAPDGGNRGGGIGGGFGFDPPMYGISEPMEELREAVRKVSVSSVPVLIEGENGTGKEIVARNIHRIGSRREKSLVIVNCMEMPATLLQGELFGHMKGAFTGAMRDRRGLRESAAGGTFFLDEIGELPPSLQASLLRVIQEKEIRRLGENDTRTVDVRFLFATNRNLVELVRKGAFREDLYFRIKGVRLFVPALRHRRKDILILASRLLEGASAAEGRAAPAITSAAARRLLSYEWPGNVRELKNEMERVVALYPGAKRIDPGMLSFAAGDSKPAREPAPEGPAGTLPGAVENLERKMIVDALERFSGNRTRTAAELGITRQGLLKKIKRYGMTQGKGN